MSQYLVIAGMSGAGRSSAADQLEDLGWFVIDNLPPLLIPKVAELAGAPGSRVQKVALVVGSAASHQDVLDALDELVTTGASVSILFLDAATDVLVRRYENTRRRHPVDDGRRLAGAIDRERAMLEPVKEVADVVVDTSELNVHQLGARIVDLFGHDGPGGGMRTTLVSFGYKHGVPIDVDVVIDCRFLPNPHWVDELRPQTGLEGPVRDFVLGQEIATPFLDRLEDLLALLLPQYVAEGKSYLSIALGCTGGRHRSVAIAEELAVRLRRRGCDPSISHRDLARAQVT
ncbi:RNase adapter RapZ [soil metagenome]